MQGADQGGDNSTGASLNGEGLHIGVVWARFNHPLTEAMRDHCLDELAQLGVASRHIKVASVPGALELPVALKALADTDDFDALIAIGCVIRGETYHFELVCNESAAGITRVSLDHQLPIANAVLTTEDEAQAQARVQDKARDAARVAVEMANLMEELG